jgi:DNA mismatch repair protein MutL
MNKIRIIPEALVNKIAAGEVVERPASVVKELIENSLDAGATEITIHLFDGGKRCIRVADNGEGMSKEDALLSFERHATSKIIEEDDLYSVMTLGFRGEALPSIASVAEVDVATKKENDVFGITFKVRNGSVQEVMEQGCPQGTTIEVRNLFHNTPARYKFLKSASTELNHIVNTVTRYTLPHTEVKFSIFHNNKQVMNVLKDKDLRTRISEVMDRKIARDFLDFKEEDHGITVSGFISSYEHSMSHRKNQYTYVNGRWIRDRLIISAIGEACRSFFMRDRFPVAILFINLSPLEVDVNVHPVKTEVRFNNPTAIYDLVRKTLKSTLTSFSPLGSSRSEILKNSYLHNHSQIKEPSPHYTGASIKSNYGENSLGYVEDKNLNNDFESDLKIIGQLWDTYILCQDKESLILLDQHAAHERVAFERLRKEYLSSGGLTGQPLLVPQIMELSPKEKTLLDSSLESLLKFGIEIEHFGGNDYVIKTLPEVLIERDCTSLIKDLLYDLFATGSGNAINQYLDNIFSTMACHSVIRGKRTLEIMEIKALLKDLGDADIASNCPHGRPVIKRFLTSEVESFFKR